MTLHLCGQILDTLRTWIDIGLLALLGAMKRQEGYPQNKKHMKAMTYPRKRNGFLSLLSPLYFFYAATEHVIYCHRGSRELTKENRLQRTET